MDNGDWICVRKRDVDHDQMRHFSSSGEHEAHLTQVQQQSINSKLLCECQQ